MMPVMGVALGSVHDSVYFTPVGQSAKVAVVDVNIGDELRCGGFVGKGEAPGGSIAVHRIKREAALLAEAYRIVQELAFAGGPEYDLMPLGRKAAERIYGKGFFPAYLRVLVFYDSPVKIYCYNNLSSFSPYP